MSTTRSNSGTFSGSARRDGFTLRILIIAMVLLTVVGAAGWYVLANSSFSLSSADSGPMYHTVERGEFVHDITERGNVESASNVEIKCQVQSQGSQGTMILWVIEEGKQVEPGDVLVTLDSSKLEDDEVKQKITCNSSEAAVIQATSNFETAQISLEEYVEGTFKRNKLDLENKIFGAQEDLRLAEQKLEYNERRLAKAYVNKLEVEASEFGVKKAEKDLDARETELMGLEMYTFSKTTKGLEADIKTSEARLKSELHSHELDKEKLKLVEEQIKACTVEAPESGQVVYANITNMRGGSETIIEDGTYVRERQTIIRLPDPKQMQVKAKINEARVALVAAGMPATVELDAFPDQILKGKVGKVNEYPIPSSYFTGSVKEYETIIEITEANLPEGLRPGLTAEIKIRVERTPSVLQVPVQAVFEHGGKHYCVMAGEAEGEWVPRQVTIGSTNDKFVVIEKRKEGEETGLIEGDKVIMAAFTYRDKLDLPELDSEYQKAGGQATPDSGADEKAGAAKPGAKPAGAKPGPQGAGGGRPDPAAAFAKMDANGDGKLDKSEIPAPMQGGFAGADKNSDGSIDKGEFTAMMAAMRAKSGGGGQRQGRPGGGNGQGGGQGRGGGSRSPGGQRPAGTGGRS
jgi:HlyD family secretion protein